MDKDTPAWLKSWGIFKWDTIQVFSTISVRKGGIISQIQFFKRKRLTLGYLSTKFELVSFREKFLHKEEKG